jgi:hypothetical protein
MSRFRTTVKSGSFCTFSIVLRYKFKAWNCAKQVASEYSVSF